MSKINTAQATRANGHHPSVGTVLWLVSDTNNGWSSDDKYSHPKEIQAEFIKLYRSNPVGWNIHWEALQYVPFNWEEEHAKWVASVEEQPHLVNYLNYLLSSNETFVNDCFAAQGLDCDED